MFVEFFSFIYRFILICVCACIVKPTFGRLHRAVPFESLIHSRVQWCHACNHQLLWCQSQHQQHNVFGHHTGWFLLLPGFFIFYYYLFLHFFKTICCTELNENSDGSLTVWNSERCTPIHTMKNLANDNVAQPRAVASKLVSFGPTRVLGVVRDAVVMWHATTLERVAVARGYAMGNAVSCCRVYNSRTRRYYAWTGHTDGSVCVWTLHQAVLGLAPPDLSALQRRFPNLTIGGISKEERQRLADESGSGLCVTPRGTNEAPGPTGIAALSFTGPLATAAANAAAQRGAGTEPTPPPATATSATPTVASTPAPPPPDVAVDTANGELQPATSAGAVGASSSLSSSASSLPRRPSTDHTSVSAVGDTVSSTDTPPRQPPQRGNSSFFKK